MCVIAAAGYGPSAKPNRKRTTSSAAIDHTHPVRHVRIDQIISVTIIMRLLENVSVSHPPGICIMVYPRKNAEPAAPSAAGDTENSCPIAASEMLNTLLSANKIM